MNPGVTGGAEGDELVGGMDAGPPVVDVQPAMEEASHPAGVAAAFVAFEDGFAVAGEVGGSERGRGSSGGRGWRRREWPGRRGRTGGAACHTRIGWSLGTNRQRRG